MWQSHITLEELEVERDGSVKTCLVVISSMEKQFEE